MNKAKIMLTAIAVFAVVGGTLAFKAAKFASLNVYCTDNSQAAKCSLTRYQSSTFTNNANHAATTSYCTEPAASQAKCQDLQMIKFIDD